MATVDMIATGTDVKPLEIVFFMRQVRSRNFFEQMKGRGIRVVNPDDLQGVTSDARAPRRALSSWTRWACAKRRCPTPRRWRKKHTIGLDKLMEAVAFGNRDPEALSSIASRLARLDRQLTSEDRQTIEKTSGGRPLASITAAIVNALAARSRQEDYRVRCALA